MRTILPLTLLAALAVAGCGEAQTPTPRDVQTGQAEGLPPMADPPQPPAPPGGEAVAVPGAAPTVLQPIVRADWEGRLESGAGCNLSVAGRDYLVVVVGDGVIKVGGRVLDLTIAPATYDDMVSGGYLLAESTMTSQMTITVEPGDGEERTQPDGTTATRSARVTVTSGGTTERFDADWTCGS